jgi:hypothetical protein
MIMEWRNPTSEERALMKRLVEKPFTGQEAVADQLRSSKVRPADQDGCLSIQVHPTAPVATVSYRVPVEAEAMDADGIAIHVLLHVVDGRAVELEMFKEDNSKVIELPAARAWEVTALG